jgi:eukaryotic-like serine/threonine-protein kinase
MGRGGMGVVWRAWDAVLHRTVAVKEIIFPELLRPAEAHAIQARAMREARSAARLTHSAVVTIYDVVQEDHHSFIVMEFVDAPTLANVVNEGGPLAPEEAAKIGTDVLDALELAHANGIVHRDVKPSNVMITDEGRAKLADFGIASLKDDPKITSTGMILGSPQFMAPEQAQGIGSGPAVDLWALGATLYFAVEGRYPFDRGEAISTLAAVVHDDFPPLLRAGYLAPAIEALLEKSPEQRPSEAEVRRMLESDVDARPASSQPSVQRDVVPVSAARSAAATTSALRRAWSIAAVLIVVVACGAAAALVATLLIDEPEQTTSSAPRDTEASGAGTGASGGDDAPAETEQPDVTVPSNWTKYRDPGSGYRLAYPPTWDLIQDAANSIDFRDPDTGTYLRVQWTTTPGLSPVGAWEDQAQTFAASHSGYEEIRITPTTYRGHEAAVWEFIYTEDGARLHAADLGFVIGDEYGFALYFQTHEEDWTSSQDLFEQLKAAFRPPSV